MDVAWLFFLIEIIICIPIHYIFKNISIDVLIIVPHFLIMWIIMMKNIKYRVPIIIGFMVRIVAMLFDCTTLILSYMNGDTLGYYDDSVRFCEKGSLIYGGMYSRILGYLFKAVGPSRVLAEYVNVILGMTTIWFLYRCIKLMDCNNGIAKRVMWLLCLFPYSIYSSCVTYRESIIATFVAASAYFALKWYLKRSFSKMVLCVSCVLFASTFHAGVIFLGVGYAMLFTLYSHKTDKYKFSRRSVFTLFIVILCLALVYALPSVFFEKLKTTNEETVTRVFNLKSGGSLYLPWLVVESLRDIVIFSPLKLLYFLFSPMPNNWRGAVDIVPFFVDSIWYFICLYYIIRNITKTPYRRFIIAVGIGWIITALVFGVGTWTAGTAIRHRNKIFEIMLVMSAASSFKTVKEMSKEKGKLLRRGYFR